jgi:hypothetical protein
MRAIAGIIIGLFLAGVVTLSSGALRTELLIVDSSATFAGSSISVNGFGIQGSAFEIVSSTGGIFADGTSRVFDVAGSGLVRDGTTANRIDIATTGVTPGSYTLADITVNAEGQITAAASGSAGGGGNLSGSGGSNELAIWGGGSSLYGSGVLTVDGSGDLVLNTDGSPATFSTKGVGASDPNIWIGGGGQVFAGSNQHGFGGNTALGVNALLDCTTCAGNTAVGLDALENETGNGSGGSGITSTAIGYGVLSAATLSVDNTAMGYISMNTLTTGQQNTAIGVETMDRCTTCDANVALGIEAGGFITTGSDNVCIGTQAQCGTTGFQNTAVGFQAGGSISTSTGNVAIGTQAMNGSGSAGVTGNANTAVGSTAAAALTSGTENTMLGGFTGTQVTSGGLNTFVGFEAGELGNTTNSTGVGAMALANETSGDGFNVAVGYSAGAAVTSGEGNTIVGYNTVTAGVTTGNFNTIVGTEINGLPNGLSNALILGAGGAGGGAVLLYQTVTMMIDARDAPTVNNGSLATGSTNAAGRVTGVGSNSSTITFGGSLTFSHDDICQAEGEGSASFGVGFSWTPSTTAPTVLCWSTTTGIAATCPNFRYWCPGF